MDYYSAKFKREAKDKPTDWLIIPARGKYELRYIGK